MVRSRSTARDCAVGVSGRDASEPLMGPKIRRARGFWGCRPAEAKEFILDLRETSLCRGVSSVNILILLNKVFLATN